MLMYGYAQDTLGTIYIKLYIKYLYTSEIGPLLPEYYYIFSKYKYIYEHSHYKLERPFDIKT